jgi:pimeloyl-ACP methyl ester carboxylesterase
MLTVDGMTTQEHFIQANGLNIYYQEVGTGEPLILLHGGTATSGSWQEHVQSYAKHFRVIVPDWRGHGKTINPTGEFNYHQLADDIVAFAQALSLNKPFICGYSDGGQIALDLGIRHPDVPGALGIGGACYKFTDLYFNTLRGMGFVAPGQVKTDDMDDDWRGYLETEHHRADDPTYWKTLVTQISHMWWRPLDYTQDDLRNITAPTLITLGDRDGIEVEQIVEMYRLIPNAELGIIPNADHGGGVGKLYTQMVLDFLLHHSAQAESSES